MATARALSLPEIVLEVLEHVFDEPVCERRPLLFALAQVSRIFRDPAVRMLWVDMPNIEPLFRLLSNCEVVPDPVNATATGEDEDGPSYTLKLHCVDRHRTMRSLVSPNTLNEFVPWIFLGQESSGSTRRDVLFPEESR
ncbi:hypothetical protein OH76DRAFT_475753 [Lentinus brumalis]|uniref:F-box domain-containing protein n=1 Tax=Lentinus brumalis TaxID=2498619 RepID=A0A371CI99_9APHY|nr:hypothetical protein OH76DRAFT_475753 [Polyporus brumalis]